MTINSLSSLITHHNKDLQCVELYFAIIENYPDIIATTLKKVKIFLHTYAGCNDILGMMMLKIVIRDAASGF
jgi:hypothetical protein